MTAPPDGMERVYEKAPDYATVYADGVIVQLGTRVCRLVFYQEHLEPTGDGKGIDKERMFVKMKHEVRLPHQVAEKLSEYISHSLKVRSGALEITEGNNDPKVTAVWWKFNNRLENNTFDTGLFIQDTKTGEALTEEFMELVGRTAQAKKESDKADDKSDKKDDSG